MSTGASSNKPIPLGVAVSASESGTVTARQAGGLRDMAFSVSPNKVPVARALQNLAKAINLALSKDFLDTELEPVYTAARVRKGTVVILHGDYLGLGDGVVATLGKVGRSIQLTLRGPDPTSPQGKEWIEKNGTSSLRGLIDFLGRKMDLFQEYEDMVPVFVEQMLDRLEAANMIVDWDRAEWDIRTTVVGLDVILTPIMKPNPTKAK